MSPDELAELQATLERQTTGLRLRVVELDGAVETATAERDAKARELRDSKAALAAVRRLRGLPPRAPRAAAPSPISLVR